MNTIEAARIFALIIMFGVLWNTLKLFAVERYPKLAAAMDYIYA